MPRASSGRAASPTLGALLKGARNKSGSSQAEIAELLQTSQGNLSRWERDLSYPQDIATLLRIQDFVKVDDKHFIDAVVASVARNTKASLLRLFNDVS